MLRLPDSLTSLSWGAFGGCTSLGEVDVGNGVTSFGGSTSTGAYDDGYGVFNGCTALTNVTFGTGLRTMNGHAFANCTRLERIVIPDNVETIGNNCFYNCAMLGSVTFGSWVTSIGAYAFAKCPCLRYLQFKGDPPTTVGSNAFDGMKSAVVIYAPIGSESWGDSWNGHVVKKVASVPADADAPWDLVFRTVTEWGEDQSFFLSSASTNRRTRSGWTSVARSRFLSGTAIYATYSFQDAWADADVPVCFTNTLRVSNVNGCSYSSMPNGMRAGNYATAAFRRYDVLQGLEPGDYTATWTLNDPRAVRETNYDNNTNSVTFIVVPSTPFTLYGLPSYITANVRFETGATFGSELTESTLSTNETRTGFRFLGWYTDPCGGVEVTRASTVPDSPTNLFVHWINSAISWKVENGEARITDCDSGVSGAVEIPEVIGGCPVTEIGRYAFYGADKITSVASCYAGYESFKVAALSLPKTLRNIANSAFNNCSSLQSLVIPNAVTNIGDSAFWGCSQLKTLDIPASVVSIGDWAFYGCARLQTVNLAATITAIPQYAFSGCTSLTSIALPDTVKSVGFGAFYNCSSLKTVDIPDSVTSIDPMAFAGCANVQAYRVGANNQHYCSVDGVLYSKDRKTLVAIPGAASDVTILDSVTSIAANAAQGSAGLTRIVIPSSVTSIASGAFANCSNLTELILSEGVRDIGQSFFGCDSLTSVSVPASVTNIVAGAFASCCSLEQVIVDPDNAQYCSIDGMLFTKDGTTLLCCPAGLDVVEISENVSKIGNYAFYGCDLIEELELPLSVIEVGLYAFGECSGLESIVGNGVRHIGSYALADCVSLEYFSFPAVETIGSYAYAGCSSVESFIVPGTVRNVEAGVFYQCTSLKTIALLPGVTNISQNALYGCTSLYFVSLPTTLTSIGERAFGNCEALVSIILPRGLNTIGNSAFGGCTSLTSVTIRSTSLPQVGVSIYDKTPSTLTTYANWDGVGVTWQSRKFSKLDVSVIDGVHDISFTLPNALKWPSAAYLKSTPEDSVVATTRFVEGNPVFVAYAWHDAKGKALYQKQDGYVTTEILYDGIFAGLVYMTNDVLGADWYIYHQGFRAFATPAVGSHTITVKLDALDAYRETDESNNEVSLPFTVVSGIRVNFVSEDEDAGEWHYEPNVAYGYFPDPEPRLGYDFVGWYTKPEGGQKQTVLMAVPSAETTLYAHWVRSLAETIKVSKISSGTTTWRSGKVYVVTSSVTVPSGATLVIEPGTVVKFAKGTSLTVASGATLSAPGTLALPIILTSVNDDESGGRADGSNSNPQGGDWQYVDVSGTANLSYCTIMYGGPSNERGLIQANSRGTLTMDSCTLAHSKYDGIWNWGGSITVRNSVFTDVGLGVAPYRGTKNEYDNCVFYGCQYILMYWSSWSGKPVFANCIFMDMSMGWTDTNAKNLQFRDGCTFKNCCFWNEPGIGLQSCDRSGCFYADPLFADAENGNFRIAANSPCVDAGLGEYAPERDYYDQPRMEVDGVRKSGSVAANGKVPDIGLYEVPGGTDVPAADLVVTSVTAPEELSVGQPATITWTVANDGDYKAVAGWRDALELVTANGMTVTLASFAGTSEILPGKSKTFTATVVIPSAAEGVCTVRVTANKFRDVFECDAYGNNAAEASSSSLSVSEVTLPTDARDAYGLTLSPDGESAFRLGNATATSSVIVLRSEGEIAAWLGNGAVATKDNAVGSVVQIADGTWLLQVPADSSPRISVANEGEKEASCELSLEVGDFFLLDTGKTTTVNGGILSLSFYGNGFNDAMSCWLAQGGSRIDAQALKVDAAVAATAVFDLTDVPAGDYVLHVKSGDDEATATLLTVTEMKIGAKWNCKVRLADNVRADRVYVGSLEYSNTGDTAMPAPYVVLTAGEGTSIRLSESDAWSDTIELMAFSSTYPASQLKPGESRKISFFYKTRTMWIQEERPFVYSKANVAAPKLAAAGAQGVVWTSTVKPALVTYSYTRSDSRDFPWETNGKYMRPSWATDEIWSRAFATLKANVGSTWNDYLDRMRADGDHLMALGQSVDRLDKIWQLEINEALGVDHAVSTLAGGTDLVRSARGFNLAFSRTYGAAMYGRLKKGSLGYGWTDNYSTYAELQDATTLAFHLASGSTYQFTKATGEWAPEDARDKTKLEETDTAYVLTYVNGTVQTVSKATMRTASIVDNVGNCLTFTYEVGSRVPRDRPDTLTRVEHSDGQFLAFTYENDKLASVSDDLGHTVTYTYTGDHLTSVTGPTGLTVRYGYLAEDATPLSRALNRITYPDGTTKDFTYDEAGRIATSAVNGDQFVTEIVRGTLGSYSIVAPNGGVTEVTVGASGETLKTVNALGQVVQQKYTADTLLESVVAPSGKRNKITYNKDGAPVTSMSASGATTTFAYTSSFDNLASVTDAKGHALNYGYDDKGRGNAITYADGSSSSISYNEKGDVARSVNRRGDSVTYEYDAEGKLTQKTWSDGRVFTMKYDAKGNVTNAADSVTGAVSMEYDEKERLTKIVHPKNRGFAYKYDAIGRTTERTALGRDGAPSPSAKECYFYDELGRLAYVTDGTNRYLTNAYDPTTGWLITQTYGNGTVVSNAYDLLGRTIGIYHFTTDGGHAGRVTLPDVDVDMDGDAQTVRSRVPRDRLSAGSPVRSRVPRERAAAYFEYTYDADGKCIKQTTAEGDETYAYDADGQLTAVTYPDGTSETFAYDAVGNRTTANGETYEVNNLNQYTTVRSRETRDPTAADDDSSVRSRETRDPTAADDDSVRSRVPRDRDLAFTYDADGNLTSRTSPTSGTTTYAYDVLNRLIAVTNESQNIRWSCAYDVFGNRTSVTDNGVTTEKLFVQGSLASVAAEYVDDAQTTRHIMIGAVRLADVSGEATSASLDQKNILYYHADMLGSVRLTTDATGAETNRASYKVFGAIRTTTDARYGHASRVTAPAWVGTLGVERDTTGLVFMRNRYYDEELGRFIQVDPIGLNAGDVNCYRYCGNDGVMAVDPLGKEWYKTLWCGTLNVTSKVGKFGDKYSRAANKLALAGMGAAVTSEIVSGGTSTPVSAPLFAASAGVGATALIGSGLSSLGTAADIERSKYCDAPPISEAEIRKAEISLIGNYLGQLGPNNGATDKVASAIYSCVVDEVSK